MDLGKPLSLMIALFSLPRCLHGREYNNQCVVSRDSRAGKPTYGLRFLDLMSRTALSQHRLPP